MVEIYFKMNTAAQTLAGGGGDLNFSFQQNANPLAQISSAVRKKERKKEDSIKNPQQE